MNQNIYFITGGAGFIGSNFINKFFNYYNNKNFLLINYDALYYSGNKNNINEAIIKDKRYKFIHGNLQSFDLLKYIFENNKITHIIHFAAQSHVQNSFDDSIQYTKNNVIVL